MPKGGDDMARVSQRLWRAPGQRSRRKAWGFTVQVDGKQKRVYKAEWTKDDAEQALAAVLLKTEQQPKSKARGLTLAMAAARYVETKARKRSLGDDIRILKHLEESFGADTPLSEITASRIAEYKAKRLSTVRKTGQGGAATERPLAAGTVNRTLALLRHLLRLACEEGEVLQSVPKIRLEKEPQGRLRWLTSDRVDRARGVILLDITKSGKRREVPLNRAADAVLARRGPRDVGLVFGSRNWDRFRTAWENAIIRAKLTDLHWHDLRHTFASWAVQRGATLQEVKELLGHGSLAMVMRYAHLSPEHLRRAVARLDGALAGTVPAFLSTQGS